MVTKNPVFTLRKVQQMQGRDGIAFNCTIVLDGKDFADCHDDGNGGCVDVHLLNRDRDTVWFREYLASQPDREYEGFGDRPAWSVPYDEEHLVNDLMDAHDEKKLFTRLCKKNIVIILKKHKHGEYAEYKKTLYTQGAADSIRERLGDELLEIVNERYI